ncbi:hypothetical protein [Nocardiopsis coralliicola]
MDSTPARARPGTRGAALLPAAGLLLLAPVSAELLSAYDDSTGAPLALLAALVFFVPLYGVPALLIREAARRFGMGWPGILALGLAFGILQAGVIDQSLFNPAYRDIDYWPAMVRPTSLAALGLSGHTALVFVAGHAVWSIGAPIAAVEAAARRELRSRPWLPGWAWLVLLPLWTAAAAAILSSTLAAETARAAPAQITGALAAVAALAALAATAGRRRAPRRNGPAPRPVAVLAVLAAAGLAFDLQAATWPGTAFGAAVLAAAWAALAWWGRAGGWTELHAGAAACGVLLSRAVIGFLAEPLGDVAPVAKYGHNTVLFLLVASVAAAVLLRSRAERRAEPESRSDQYD